MTPTKRDRVAKRNRELQAAYVAARDAEAAERTGPYDPRLGDPRYAGLTANEATGEVSWTEDLSIVPESAIERRVAVDVVDFDAEGGRPSERLRRGPQ